MWLQALFGALCLWLSAPRGVSGRDDTLKLDIPEDHGTQEIYNAFKKEPKEERVGERMADLVAAAAKEKTGTVCEAPPSYRGECMRSVDTSEFTVERKMLFMSDCRVQWPCKSGVEKTDAQYCPDTERNFLQPCPENFLRHKQDSGYVCVPDFSGYVGPCNSIVDFSNFSREAKMVWAQTCGTTWPCMTICPKVFDRCPLDWRLAPDGACEAPASYKGPCEKREYFTYYTQEMKRKRLIECDIPFECSSDCRRDYNRCPVLWKSEADGYCAPPSDTVSCRDVLAALMKEAGRSQAAVSTNAFDLRSLDVESKKLYESKCSNVEFPCMEEDDGINWSLQCPRGWTISRDDLRSCRPPRVDDDDVCQSQVTFSDEEEKRAFASRCQINWSGRDLPKEADHVVKHSNHDSGPITDIGSVHSLSTAPDLAPSPSQRLEGAKEPSNRRKGPKERTVSVTRRSRVLDVTPYVVQGNRPQNRRLFKGFTREVHLLPGST
ncbi:CPW-WPC domain-containing protein [Babesia caballi]|uniref:CPW-WPC domain-containing protein n=1 Tax=Babesia caballi TaxID=5871 RepID=A0AAV4LPY6_BABCB|nr:CPW-WPC domain-containing protein [Babesia caballi]